MRNREKEEITKERVEQESCSQAGEKGNEGQAERQKVSETDSLDLVEGVKVDCD